MTATGVPGVWRDRSLYYRESGGKFYLLSLGEYERLRGTLEREAPDPEPKRRAPKVPGPKLSDVLTGKTGAAPRKLKEEKDTTIKKLRPPRLAYASGFDTGFIDD